MLKAVIVDDEKKAIQSLSWELSHFNKEITIINTFTDPEKALLFIAENTIDCLFLDIGMPTMDGFQFIERLNKRDFAIIIVTAYNEYAIKALKNEAIDYLLKPVDSDDLRTTLNRIKKYHSKLNNAKKYERILTSFNAKFNQRKISFNTDGKLIFLEINDILYVESDGNYCTVYTTSKEKKILLTKKLKEVDAILPSEYFFRIHNSYIINLNKIKEFLKTDGYVILEGNNNKLPVSRQRKAAFLQNF